MPTILKQYLDLINNLRFLYHKIKVVQFILSIKDHMSFISEIFLDL